ncbi:hypothetical protein L484_006071 [Morus notabilis]|uniref:Uncharacterized protein n=1 Tax=Morus notabilis TaxID=981085 RepID=W9QLA5_9ROSA|nr:hypothetical protein L484_006071 [Morus notabilis]
MIRKTGYSQLILLFDVPISNTYAVAFIKFRRKYGILHEGRRRQREIISFAFSELGINYQGLASNTRSNSDLLDAIANANGGGHAGSQTEEDNGVVRLKIVVRKQDLKQMLEAMGGCSKNNSMKQADLPSLSVEQRLNLLRKKHHILKANLAKQNRIRSSWSPVLRSINPEEL